MSIAHCPSSASAEALLTSYVTKLGQNDFENPVQIVLMISTRKKEPVQVQHHIQIAF